MKMIRISEAAREMGFCRQYALRQLKKIQVRNPDIEILVTRYSGKAHWRINPVGLRRAVELEKQSQEANLSHRVGLLESDTSNLKKKLRRLEIYVSSIGNGESSKDHADANGTKLE